MNTGSLFAVGLDRRPTNNLSITGKAWIPAQQGETFQYRCFVYIVVPLRVSVSYVLKQCLI